MTHRFVAGHVPGVAAAALRCETLRFHDNRDGAAVVEVEVPALDAGQFAAVAAHVRRAARTLRRERSVSQIVAAIDAAVGRLLDRADPHRRTLDTLLPIVTGYDAETIRLALGSYLQAFRAPELHRFVAEDFANPKVLDEFQPAVKGGRARCVGPDLLLHNWSGNVPGLPLWSLASGLLVKGGNVGKLPSSEPVFASVFAHVLAGIDPVVADATAIVWWKGDSADAAQPLFDAADVVLAYGGDATIDAVRARVPATTRFLPYGNRIGVSLVGREALDSARAVATARRAARDVARYDQQGCYSSQRIYVERGGAVDPRAFAQYVASELANLGVRFPRRRLTLEESAAVGQWRDAHVLSASGSALIGDRDATFAVACTDAMAPLAPSATQRTVTVVAVDSLDDALAAIAPAARVLQTAGVAVDASRLGALADALADAGVTRIAPLGRMTMPEAGWHHDGRCNLADLVRWIEIEGAAERYADTLAAYADEASR